LRIASSSKEQQEAFGRSLGYVLAVIIDKYLPPTYDQKGGKHTLLHTYTCDNALFSLVP
jgi:hypothetical protein